MIDGITKMRDNTANFCYFFVVGKIAGIVIGSVVFYLLSLVAVGLLVGYFFRKNR